MYVQETYFRSAAVLKNQAIISFPKPSYNYSYINLIPQSNILHIYGYN